MSAYLETATRMTVHVDGAGGESWVTVTGLNAAGQHEAVAMRALDLVHACAQLQYALISRMEHADCFSVEVTL